MCIKLKNFILLLVMVTILGSCTTTKYVPVTTTSIEYKDRIVRDTISTTIKLAKKDSIIYKDSVVYVLDKDGNIIKEKYYSLKEKYSDTQSDVNFWKSKFDSISSIKKDSVQVPYPVVTNELTTKQKLSVLLGKIALVLIPLLIVVGRKSIIPFFSTIIKWLLGLIGIKL